MSNRISVHFPSIFIESLLRSGLIHRQLLHQSLGQAASVVKYGKFIAFNQPICGIFHRDFIGIPWSLTVLPWDLIWSPWGLNRDVMANNTTWTMFKSRNVIPWNFGWKKWKNRFPSETGWSSFLLEIMTAEPIVNQQQCLAAHPHLKCHSNYSAQSHLQPAATAHDSFKSFKLCKLGIYYTKHG